MTRLTRMLSSLRIAPFRRFYIALVVAMSGFWVRIGTLGWLVYDITGSHERLGTIVAASLLPWVVAGPLGGVLADRYDPRKIIPYLLSGLVLINASLAVGLLLGKVGYVHLLVATVLAGCLRGLEHPARHSLMVRLVPIPMIPNAVGLNAAGFHLASAIGSLLVALLYPLIGPGGCYFVVAAGVLPMLALVRTLRPERDTPPQEPRSVLADLAAGFRYVVDHRRTRLVLGCASAAALLLWSFRTLMAPLAKDVLAVGERGYGHLMAVLGFGSLLGALTVAGQPAIHRDAPPGILRYALAGLFAVALLAWGTTLFTAVPALLLAGFCNVCFMARSNVLVQSAVPEALRARVMGIWALTFALCWPLGSLLMGFWAGMFSVPIALGIGAGGTLLALVVFAVVARRLGARVSGRTTQQEPGESLEPTAPL